MVCVYFYFVNSYARYTVKKFDIVVRNPHLVTQDQFSLVSGKDSGIPEDNLIINIELLRQTFTNVELLRQIFQGANLHPQIYMPIFYHCATFSSYF